MLLKFYCVVVLCDTSLLLRVILGNYTTEEAVKGSQFKPLSSNHAVMGFLFLAHFLIYSRNALLKGIRKRWR